MNFLTEKEYLTKMDRYYTTDRWNYYKIAISFAQEIKPKTILELGPREIPLCKNEDTIDINPQYNPTYLHDATITPWPITKKYDLFIGLQVFEHLEQSQQQAFLEVTKIAKNIIISLPYNWKNGKDKSHLNISDETILKWTSGIQPTKTTITQDHGPKKRQRIICLYQLYNRFI